MKYAIGAGFEYAFADNWSARAEYLFLNQSLNTQVFDNGAGFIYASRIRNENHIVALRPELSFRRRESNSGAIEYGTAASGRNGHNGGNGGARCA